MIIRKPVLILGAVLVSLMMISSVSAVQQVNSQSLMNSVEKERKIEDLDFLSVLTNYEDFEADKDRVLETIEITKNFVEEKLNIGVESESGEYNFDFSNLETSSYYQNLDFQNFLNKLENEFQSLADDADDRYKQEVVHGEDVATKIILTEVIKPRIESFFNKNTNDEYASILNSFHDTSSDLAEEYKDVFDKAKSKSLLNMGDENKNQISTMSYGIDQVLIAICTAIFFINWFLCGHILGELTQPLVALVLGIILVIPAVVILAGEVVIEGVNVLFESLLATTVFMLAFMGETLSLALYNFGAVGGLVWFLIFMLNLELLPIEFFVIFIVIFIENAGFEIGYISRNLGPYITEVLWQAAENARDLYNSIFGDGPLEDENNDYNSLFKRLISFLFNSLNRFSFRKNLVLQKI